MVPILLRLISHQHYFSPDQKYSYKYKIMLIFEQNPLFSQRPIKQSDLPSHAERLNDSQVTNMNKQVAQGQYVVSDTRCPAFHDCELDWEEAGQRPQRGRSPVEHRGTFVREMANGL